MAERKHYFVMYPDGWFSTTTRKDRALRDARVSRAIVYAVPASPWPTYGWDCPTVRASFDPIYVHPYPFIGPEPEPAPADRAAAAAAATRARARAHAKHRRQDPHCTCNDCMHTYARTVR